MKTYGFDDEGMLDLIDQRTKIIFLCNPNNPTGTYWDHAKLRRFLDAVDGRRIVVVDEAYSEFVETDDYLDGIALIDEYPNLLVFRTFSKMYGLAGLRIGYLVGDLAVVNAIRRTCIVYSVNAMAQEAAAAAVDADEHAMQTRQMVREGKAFLRQELMRLGLPCIVGQGNYLLIRLPMSDALAFRKLMAEGFMVRTMGGFRFPNHIRVTISTMDVMEAFISALWTVVK